MLLAACDNRSSFEKLGEELEATRQKVGLENTSDWAEKGFPSQEAAIDAYWDAEIAEYQRLAQEKEAADKAKALYDTQVAQSLVSPKWVPADNLPEGWGRLHSMKKGEPCNFGGFERSVLFSFRNPKNNTSYTFQFTKAPPGVGWGDSSILVINKHKVWVSSLNPNLYLTYRKSIGDFSIYLVRDDGAYYRHEALDREPYDSFQMLKFKEADYRRWSVDTSRTADDQEDTHVVCDEIKYAHLLDHKWPATEDGRTSGSKTLRELMN